MLPTLRTLAVAASLLSTIPTAVEAQQTFDVATVSEFQNAYSLAAEGDTILFAPGLYTFSTPGFDVSKAIRLASQGGTVGIDATAAPSRLRGPASGGALVVEGLDFVRATNLIPVVGLEVSGGPGSVWLVDCVASAPYIGTPGVIVSDATLFATDCRFSGGEWFLNPLTLAALEGGSGILSSQADLRLDGCTLLGGDGVSQGFPPFEFGAGGHALEATGGSIIATATKFVAGDGGSGTLGPMTPPPQPGGDALRLEGNVPVDVALWRCRLEPGVSKTGGAAGEPFAGQGYDPTSVFEDPFDVGLDAPNTALGGQSVQIDFATSDLSYPRFLLVDVVAGPPLLGSLAFDYVLGSKPLSLILPAAGPLTAVAPSPPNGTGALWLSLQGVTVAANQPVFTAPRWLGIF